MGRLNESLDLKHDVNLFGYVFGKMNVLEWPLSRNWDFSLEVYKVWWMRRLNVSLYRKHDVDLFDFVFGIMTVMD